jgi:transposase InsO family protein
MDTKPQEVSMSESIERERKLAITRYLQGEDSKSIYTSLRRSKRWFFKWLDRYDPESIDWFKARSRRPLLSPTRTPTETAGTILSIRDDFDEDGVFCGAQAIQWEMEERRIQAVPSVRTINRVLKRNNRVVKGQKRYEPKGKKYPALPADRPNQTHQADLLGPFYLGRSKRFYSLNVIDLATGRHGNEPLLGKDSQSIINGLWAVWHRLGIPENLQVDNEACFYGSRKYPRGMGALIRLCLHNHVQPWFIPYAEPWRNGVVEQFNHHYRQKFLRKVSMTSLEELRKQSLLFEQKHNSRYRYSKLHGKTPLMFLKMMNAKLVFPEWQKPPTHPMEKPCGGAYNLVRFVRSDLILDIFGERMTVSPEWEYQYVVATIDVKEQKLNIYIDRKKVAIFKYKLR